ncbi:hypothetical protein LY28_00293 [Ruminiclostridium sufflavum DSM 19573]|uniref:Uncharacterized protein n=1 Tax=Ruminiclostridium sufflavum DSM 19573 TaxID=1121337 RepID=A0A318YAV0_9FIRM|nr:hypothetical protein [Ruminiclostridium sufflavum]PYG89701.1 hypothetical protein LY28_00293 [Ruminiclostridium sufflavum DSM 19573]
MPEKVIIKPDITPEERLKRLNNIADVLTRITGFKYEYIDNDKLPEEQRTKAIGKK